MEIYKIIKTSFSFNLKLSQTNNVTEERKLFYNENAADETKDPEILRKILEKDNIDAVSKYAANNPNCPPDALRLVLERENDDTVSQLASENPNCPPDALAKWFWKKEFE